MIQNWELHIQIQISEPALWAISYDIFVVIFSALWKNPILDLQKLNAELK